MDICPKFPDNVTCSLFFYVFVTDRVTDLVLSVRFFKTKGRERELSINIYRLLYYTVFLLNLYSVVCLESEFPLFRIVIRNVNIWERRGTRTFFMRPPFQPWTKKSHTPNKLISDMYYFISKFFPFFL